MDNVPMENQWPALMAFLAAASFTPGPNNMTCAALGMQGGYRRAFPFVMGVYVGVFFLLLATGLLKVAVQDFFVRYQLVFKIAGTAYLLYLAAVLAFKNHDTPTTGDASGNFFRAVALQVVNPKGLFFTFTYHSLFFNDGDLTFVRALGIAGITPLMTIASTSTWALLGSFISTRLENPKVRKGFYVIMALFLVYTAVTILFHQF